MEGLYEIAIEASNDLVEIWWRIAEDSVDLANRIETEFYELFTDLGQNPWIGHERKDLTSRRLRFFPLYSFLVVYEPDVKPIRIVAVLRGRRNIRRILRERRQRM